VTTPGTQVITFYSTKGGVGRSMTAANVAWALASAGKRVLIMDWDLEAPGLHHYFAPFLVDPTLGSTTGVVDALIDFLNGSVSSTIDIKSYAVSLNWEFSTGALDFVPSGQQSASYSTLVSRLPWADLLRSKSAEDFIAGIIGSASHDYDYVLLDSRSGYNEVSALCSRYLADAVVLCFTLTGHMIEASRAAAEIIATEAIRPYVRIFPVPTLVELAEHDLLMQSRERARAAFERFTAHLPAGDAQQYWREVETQYRPIFAYGATLAAFVEEPHQTSVLSAAESLAYYLTGIDRARIARPSDQQRRAILANYRNAP